MIIHSLIYSHCIGAVAHLARAFEWHSKGGGFESHQLHNRLSGNRELFHFTPTSNIMRTYTASHHRRIHMP